MTTPKRDPTRAGPDLMRWNRLRLLLPVLLLVLVGIAAAVGLKKGGVREAVLPAGTRIVAALDHTVSTEGSSVGERVTLKTRAPVPAAEGDSLPPGAVVTAEVTRLKGGGRIAGAPELTLRFTSIRVDGRDYDLAAEPFRIRGHNDAAESAAEIGGGAVAGGVIGAVAGSAAKGALVGAVLGTGVAVATRGDQLVLPAGQRLRIRLSAPLTVRYRLDRKET